MLQFAIFEQISVMVANIGFAAVTTNSERDFGRLTGLVNELECKLDRRPRRVDRVELRFRRRCNRHAVKASYRRAEKPTVKGRRQARYSRRGDMVSAYFC